MKKYISYEEGCKGTYTLEEMKTLYKTEVDKEEYPTFEDWLWDMLKSGVFEVETISFTTEQINKAKELSYENDIESEIGFEYKGQWIVNPFLEVSARFEFTNYEIMCEYYGTENVETFIDKILNK